MNHKFIKGRELDKDLRALYEESGRLPNMRHIEHKPRHRATRILVVLILFLITLISASWAGFFLFGTQSGGGEIKLEWQGPEMVVAGMPQDITLRYKNMDSDPLASSVLRIRIPENLVVQTTEPLADQEAQLQWNLGTLPAKSEQEIHFTIIPYGIENDELELQALFTFKPANFNAEFQTSATHKLIVRASAITVTLEGPEQALPGEDIELKASVKNITDQPFEELSAFLNVPAVFLLNANGSTANQSGLEIGKLGSGEEKQLLFNGSFLSNAEGPQDITFEVKIKRKELNFTLAQAVYTIQTANTGLSLTLYANENPNPTWIGIDQDLNLRLSLTNNSKTPFENIKAMLNVKGDFINLTSASAIDGTINNNSFTFPKNKTVTLEPGATRDFKASLKTAGSTAYNGAPFIEISGTVSYGKTVLRALPLKLIVVSDLRLLTQARYFDFNQSPIGSGPMPPRVGEETKYKVRFNLKNTFHDLSNIVVTASLPEQGRWIGNTETASGKIYFNEVTREINWEIPRLPVTVTELSANFDIGITPIESDRGKLILLLGIARASALDTIAQVNFSTDAPSISSSLDLDPLAKGKGVVE